MDPEHVDCGRCSCGGRKGKKVARGICCCEKEEKRWVMEKPERKKRVTGRKLGLKGGNAEAVKIEISDKGHVCMPKREKGE